jgi:uncharacterized protein (DUF1330 family)
MEPERGTKAARPAQPPVYTVAEIDVADPAAYSAFAQKAQAAIKAAGGKITSIEGEPPKSRVVIQQWDSLEKFQAPRNSAAFKELLPVARRRQNSTPSSSRVCRDIAAADVDTIRSLIDKPAAAPKPTATCPLNSPMRRLRLLESDQCVLIQSRASRCAAATSASDISSATSRRI